MSTAAKVLSPFFIFAVSISHYAVNSTGMTNYVIAFIFAVLLPILVTGKC